MAKIQEADLILNPDGSVYHLNVLPHQISDTIIAVGDPDRVTHVSRYFDGIEFEINKREFITHTGTYRKKRITVISSGIGTDNVEILMTELDALVNVDLKLREPGSSNKKLKIIRIGTSGSLHENIPVGAHLVSDYAVGLDNLMTFYDLRMDEIEKDIGKEIQSVTGLPFTPYVVKGSETLKKQVADDMISGNTVTCPGFYAPQGRKVRLDGKYVRLLESLRTFKRKNSDFRLTNLEMETAGYYGMGRLLGHEVLSVNGIVANRVKNEFAKDPVQIVDELIKKVLDRI